MEKSYKHAEISEQIIKAFYTVYNALGHGFLEKIYVTALSIELKKIGLDIKNEHPLHVFYKEKAIGEFFADIIVQDCIIVEAKAVKKLAHEHEAQLLNYLKGTKIEVGLLLNFGPKPEIKRMAFTNARK